MEFHVLMTIALEGSTFEWFLFCQYI